MAVRTTGMIAVLATALIFGFIGGVLGHRWADGGALQAAPPARVVPAAAGPSSFAAVAAAVIPTVVNIDTVSYQRAVSPFDSIFGRGFREEAPLYRTTGGGSGFIVRQDGIIVTNHHVIDTAAQITVTLADGRQLPGRVLGSDRVADLAIVKIDAAGLPVAALGDSSRLHPGDWSIAIGNPFGFDHTVTAGVISALGRPIYVERENRRYPNLIQTDAMINQGNSGGPLINSAGEVVGINTAIFAAGPAAAPIGFAIPINDAKHVIQTLVTRGKVSRSWIGVSVVNVTPGIAQAYRLPVRQGVIVRRPVEGGPAWRAGLQPMDIIETMNGKPVTDRGQFLYDINVVPAGSQLHFEIRRLEGERWQSRRISITTTEMPES